MDLNRQGSVRFGKVVEEAIARGEICGGVAAISTPRYRHMQAFGVCEVETGTPMKLDAIFRMASMTKPIIAAAAMMLVEDGKIDLDASIYHDLPEFADQRVLRTPGGQIEDTVPRQRDVSYFDLLTFQLGIGMYMGGPFDYPICQIASNRDPSFACNVDPSDVRTPVFSVSSRGLST